MESGSWKQDSPPARAWKGRSGLDRAARTAEQDRAAGGHDRRLVDLGDGRTARASVELKVFSKTRRIRAYLRWSDRGRTRVRYLGEVSENTRTRNLASAWCTAIDRELVIPLDAAPSSWASSPAVRAVMKANRSRDTKPELALRAAVRGLGLRYRVDVAPVMGLRRRADLAFPGAKVAVFSDGCYWHGCPEHYRPARRNSDFWSAKISGNRERDRDTDAELAAAGWLVIRIWEHEDPVEAASRIANVITERRASGPAGGMKSKPEEAGADTPRT
ncbi:very short patch repair endonuclease [Frankia canadensis]|nr:very short patch repair endonuclease [Frankia canadensis]